VGENFGEIATRLSDQHPSQKPESVKHPSRPFTLSHHHTFTPTPITSRGIA
jgi:hypothetical protein